MYVNVRSGRLGMKRPWLKYIEEENKMHCVTRKVKLTNVLSQKCVYSWDRQFNSDCRISRAFKKSSENL